MAETAPTASPARKRPRRKRGWFLLLVGMFNAVWALIVLCALVAVAAVYFFYDRPVVLPGWVETRIEARSGDGIPRCPNHLRRGPPADGGRLAPPRAAARRGCGRGRRA